MGSVGNYHSAPVGAMMGALQVWDEVSLSSVQSNSRSADGGSRPAGPAIRRPRTGFSPQVRSLIEERLYISFIHTEKD